MPKSPILILLCAALLSACVYPHHTFVPPGYDPISITKKKQVEFTGSLRPIKLAKVSATYGLTNWLALRAGYTGFFGLDNFEGSLLAYAGKKRPIYGGLVYNYEHNTIHRSYGFAMYGVGRRFKYNCEYQSPGMVLLYTPLSNEEIRIQLIAKASKNFVSKYSMDYVRDNASGKGGSFYVADAEHLSNAKIPSFYSGEFSISLMGAPNAKANLMLQIGYNYTKQTLLHKYSFHDESYDHEDRLVNTSKLHPISNHLWFSIGGRIKIGKS